MNGRLFGKFYIYARVKKLLLEKYKYTIFNNNKYINNEFNESISKMQILLLCQKAKAQNRIIKIFEIRVTGMNKQDRNKYMIDA